VLWQAAFEAAGYQLPQVVFWNLSESRIIGQKSTPVTMNEQGVALVSGFRWVSLSGPIFCTLPLALMAAISKKPMDIVEWQAID